MRRWASVSISSRSPKTSASAGQALTQAGTAWSPRKFCDSGSVSGCPLREVGSGWLPRSAQWVHFWISGLSEFHSAVGTSQEQASMQ